MLNRLQEQLSSAARPQQAQAQKAFAQPAPGAAQQQSAMQAARSQMGQQQNMSTAVQARQAMPAPVGDPRKMAAAQVQTLAQKTGEMGGTLPPGPRGMGGMLQARAPVNVDQQTQYLTDRQMREPIPSSYAPADGRDLSAALAQQQMMSPEEQQMQAMPAPQTPFAYPRESRQMMSPPQQGGNDQRARLLAEMSAQRDRAQFYGR
jgi:hypothetical protein